MNSIQMQNDLQQIEDRLSREQGKQEGLWRQLKIDKKQVTITKRDIRNIERALGLINKVAMETQRNLQYHVSDITSMAHDAIFPDPYSVKIDFVERRNKTECDILLQDGQEEYDAIDGTGGGVVDVTSFALRCSSLVLSTYNKGVMLLDEPFKHLSENLMENAGQMLSEISRQLNMQIILTTHSRELAGEADKIIEVDQKNGKSFLKTS